MSSKNKIKSIMKRPAMQMQHLPPVTRHELMKKAPKIMDPASRREAIHDLVYPGKLKIVKEVGHDGGNP